MRSSREPSGPTNQPESDTDCRPSRQIALNVRICPHGGDVQEEFEAAVRVIGDLLIKSWQKENREVLQRHALTAREERGNTRTLESTEERAA